MKFLLFLTSWEVLGGLGALLGGSWGGLGRSWGALGAIFFGDEILIVFLIDFGTEKGAQRGGFGSQNESKIVPKTKTKTKTKKRLSWEPLGSILGRFGGRLGVKKHQNSLAGLVFREK